MKRLLTFKSVSVCIMTGMIALLSCAEKQTPLKVELLSNDWIFKATQSAQSTLTNQTPEAELVAPTDSANGFSIKLTIDLKAFQAETKVLEIPGVVSLRLRRQDPQVRDKHNYAACKMPDGSVPVLEAGISLQLPTEGHPIQEMIVGVPLGVLDNPAGQHEVVLNFSGIAWTIYVDGRLIDNDFALGYPRWTAKTLWNIHPDYISKADIYYPCIKPDRMQPGASDFSPEIQYWTPPGHNTWVGDVATLYHNGRYHIFYLYDRRWHGSKFGRGAHYFEHISTADFKTWTEHEAATPIEEQWETFGTGTPFVYDGKLCVSYGLHTTRIYPREKTTLPVLWEYYQKHGHTGKFYNETTSGIPAGSTYSISEDGISKFKKTNILFHPCENPSVYTDPDGNLKMLANYGAKGTWQSDSINGGWYSLNPDFPPGGDCTFFFRWGKFDYVIGGFTGLWSKPATAPESDYKDVVAQGLDFYNGMSVPAISEIADGRFLMAGWMHLRGWGGTLNIHELIQYPDGRIGTKWMDEIIPQTEKANKLVSTLAETTTYPVDNESFLLTFEVHPSTAGKGKLGVLLLPATGDKESCEVQIRLDDTMAQYGKGSLNTYTEKMKSLRQGGAPQGGKNYAIENLIDVDKPFKVRMVVKGSDKFGGTLLDTEIAGQRTMISFRPDLTVQNLLFRTEGVELKDIQIAPLKY